jgi:hypothetical protein
MPALIQIKRDPSAFDQPAGDDLDRALLGQADQAPVIAVTPKSTSPAALLLPTWRGRPDRPSRRASQQQIAVARPAPQGRAGARQPMPFRRPL